MIIKNKRKEMVRFDNIRCGEVFEYSGDIYMRIETTYCDDNGYYENAVDLADGSLHYFKDDNMLHVIKCELVID